VEKGLKILQHAAGGHRIQRVPPSEKRGRVHTSTVTVAIIDPLNTSVVVSDDDFRVEWFNRGNGGQNQNKHANCVRVVHEPTGLTKIAVGKNRITNLREAKAALLDLLTASQQQSDATVTASIRKRQVGSGMRADKTVTIRFQDNRVQHHITGKTMKANKYERIYE